MTQGLRIRVRGQVQGVGFRPFVWQLAQRFNIVGEVLNDPEGVLVLAHGRQIDRFLAALSDDAPPLARVDRVEAEPHLFAAKPQNFEITASRGSGAETRVTPDAATCPACLADIRGENPRRRGYAFTNCTHCGPRFTILRALPYDRARTSMASFQMCADCAHEYSDPADRRFHAQPVACAACGPHLSLDGDPAEVIARAVRRLEKGQILAIKGLGGFHLCCDATNAEAVERLRHRKHRPAKPLALMGRRTEIARFADVSDDAWDALSGPAAPIVLLPKAAPLPDSLAPGQVRLGWMLPYTPLHHLLMDAFARPLVMTSGNLSGEPQVIGNAEARDKLGDIADGILDHDRDIARRLDDSVMQLTPHGPMILRRARGLVPETLALPPGFEDAPQITAFGAHLKSAICLTKNGQALLSHHLGDLDDALTWDEFVKADSDYAALFDHEPHVFACDLHPDYRSSRHAASRAGGKQIEVQHHHAHLAACLAENAWPSDGGPVAGIILDGLGLGTDGSIWGGEILLGDYAGFDRKAWLRPTALPGGDAANREPWRNALAHLDAAGLTDLADTLFPEAPRDMLRQAVTRGVNAPLSSSAGRLFDAFAAVIGAHIGPQTFEGEAAMSVEALARQAPDNVAGGYDFGGESAEGALDLSPLWRSVASELQSGTCPKVMALRFHMGLATAFARQARGLVDAGLAHAVALSGGCFQNALLLDLTLEALGNIPVLIHKTVPANDGGIALGQALVAAAQSLDNR